MKNLKNKLKFIFAMVVLALGFSFCFSMVSVNAETTTTSESLNGTYTYIEEGKGTLTITLYSGNTYDATIHNNETNEDRLASGAYSYSEGILTIKLNNEYVKFRVNGTTLTPVSITDTTSNENLVVTPTTDTTTETIVDTEIVEPEETVEPTSFLSHLKDLKWEEAEEIIGWILGYVSIDFLLKVISAIIIIIYRLKNDDKIKILKEAAIQAEIEHQHKMEELTTKYNKEVTSIKEDVKTFIQEQKDAYTSLANDQTKAITTELQSVTELLK